MKSTHDNKKLRKLKTTALFSLFSFSFSLSTGCSQLDYKGADAMMQVARDLGANVRVRGELGPASFGTVFQADLGARLKIEGETNTNSVSVAELMEVNERLLDLVEQLIALSAFCHPEEAIPMTSGLRPKDLASGGANAMDCDALSIANRPPTDEIESQNQDSHAPEARSFAPTPVGTQDDKGVNN